ncbi:hypothetical protein [Nakamurella lactea]|uniref:hypothetical protein n=1 Tax=Nakamurella lactea TaxID=459515 RepID=UPI0012B5242A|nr:hypothetical protein [Nakamurella lactea]
MTRRRRSRQLRTGLAALGLVLLAVTLASTSTTLAAWTDRDYGKATFTAGNVSPPTGLSCLAGVSRFDLTWTLPAGGLARTGYTWVVKPIGALGPSGSGTINNAAATTVRLNGGGILTVGSGTFELRATGPGGWKSTPVTATLNVALGLLTSCSVP